MRVPIRPPAMEEIRARSSVQDEPTGVTRPGRRYLRIAGGILLAVGLVACVTVHYAKIGVALVLVGGILILAGRSRA